MTYSPMAMGLARLINSRAAILLNRDAGTLAEVALASGVAQKSGEAIAVKTGVFTGRSPRDKFIVEDVATASSVDWNANRPMSPAHFDRLLGDMLQAIAGKPLDHQQLAAGRAPLLNWGIDLFTDSPWHALFARQLLVRPQSSELENFQAVATILHLPGFEAVPSRHGTRSATCIALDMSRNVILICGTAYAGEIKKSVFTLFNFHAPAEDILPMHCAANVGAEGDVALFFGLSGTGKTTLSTAPDRALIGDDEHGWAKDGVFNLEGGCYAKAANLSAKGEPEIYAASGSAGAVLENVAIDPATRAPDFTDLTITENTRIAYPLEVIANRENSGTGGSPRNIIYLAADAFGVLPPVARLDRAQAIYYFLSGYTAKLAGTECGVTAPEATFSACFGAPFMPRRPQAYGQLLTQRLAASSAQVWLVNTGWSGGSYGVGRRMPLEMTRRIVAAILSGELAETRWRTDPVFGFEVPEEILGIDARLLDPAANWPDRNAYFSRARDLAERFELNFERLGSFRNGEFAHPKPRPSPKPGAIAAE